MTPDGESRIAALPAATDWATCANVKSMNKFACSIRVASRPSKVRRPRTSFPARWSVAVAANCHLSCSAQCGEVDCPDGCIARVRQDGKALLDLQLG